jgi:hypothetical protein
MTDLTGTLQGTNNMASVGHKQTIDILDDKRSNKDSTGQKQVIDTLQDRKK